MRDTWVRRNADPATLLEMVDHIDSEICLSESATLVDFAEAVGLSELNPRDLPVDKLVADLISDVDVAKLSASAVKEILRRSADWLEEHPTLATWFEDNVTKGIGSGRTPPKRST